MERGEALSMLRTALAREDADLHPGQWEAIDALVNRSRRVLVVQRTGWGKSVVYFIATRELRDRGRGTTLLISPLLALMRNQVLAAGRLGLNAERIASDNREDWEQTAERVRNGDVDLLIVSPERLANEEFREDVLLPLAEVMGMFVVDEAHCISDWGHDFRPDYRRIARVLKTLPPNIPVLATTATANDRVVEDIEMQMGNEMELVRGPLTRPSLRFQNIELPHRAARLAWLAEQVPDLPGSGIIYVLTKRDARVVAEWLQSRGIEAEAYHGGDESSGMPADRREALERALLDNTVKALVSTSALGMGFDKPDLGFVVHFQRPGSVVHYYQQAGRAGRAVDEAFALMLCGAEDEEINNYFIDQAFSPLRWAPRVIEVIKGSGATGLSATQIAYRADLGIGETRQLLKMLATERPAPISATLVRNGRYSKTLWVANPVAWKPDQERIDRVTALRRNEQEQMMDYMSSSECLMSFLADALNDSTSAPCGRCAPCLGEELVPSTYSSDIAKEAIEFLQRQPHRIRPRKMWMTDALAERGWTGNIKPELQCAEGRALTHWGDPVWGEMVKAGKAQGEFSDELVQEAARLITERWTPDPFPTWVTAVPSLNHLDLVPEFASRLATVLGIPYVQCIRKTRATAPQKEMNNPYRQAKNLAGAFEVQSEHLQLGPVLLVDDMVDSRWTFTIVGAELRFTGCEMVYPFALADTSHGG